VPFQLSPGLRSRAGHAGIGVTGLRRPMIPSLVTALLLHDRRGTNVKADPDDEPGIYLFYALTMLVVFIAAGVVAAVVLIHASH